MAKMNDYNDSEVAMDSKFIVHAYSTPSQVYNCYVYGEINYTTDMINIIAALDDAQENDRVNLHLNSNGGSLEATDALLTAMDRCKAPIHVIASGIVASAATLILLQADSFEMSEFCSLLFHSASFGVVGKSEDVVATANFHKKQCEAIMRSYYKDILTDYEINDMLDNKRELFMTAKEFAARYNKKQEKLSEDDNSYEDQD